MEDTNTVVESENKTTEQQNDKKEEVKKKFSIAKSVKRSDGKLYTVVKLFS